MALLSKKDKAEMEERAAENRRLRAESVREQIQTGKLVKLLEDHALGKGRAKMTPAKLKAIEMLLDKSLPDLSSVKVDLEAKNVSISIGTAFVKPQGA